MPAHQLNYSVLAGRFAVCRMAPDVAVPEWAIVSKFFSITRSMAELSVVCEEKYVPTGIQTEGGWACIQLHGPFPFQMTGVLAGVLNPLAEIGIGIFAVSTFDSDYILIKAGQVLAADDAMRAAGHERVA